MIAQAARTRLFDIAYLSDDRKWGLGLDHVRLTTMQRTAVLFMVVMPAYLLPGAFGAFAEVQNFGRSLKANTVEKRVLSLAAIGNHVIEFIGRITFKMAIEKLIALATQNKLGITEGRLTLDESQNADNYIFKDVYYPVSGWTRFSSGSVTRVPAR
jgi:hypothetical protein